MYKTCVLSGGMARGLYQLGVLMHLEEKGLLQSVTKFRGSSVGSIISFYLVSGMRPMQAFQTVFNTNIEFTSADMDVVGIKNTWGIFSVDKLMEYVAVGVKGRFADPYQLTFQELFNTTGKNLVVVSTNLTSKGAERFSYLTHPDMKVFKAMSMSVNLPLLFAKNVYDDAYHVDAGLSDNFPILSTELDVDEGGVVGVDTTAGASLDYNPKNFLEYVYRISIIPMLKVVGISTNSTNADVIHVPERLEDMGYIFSVPGPVKWSMFSHGYKTAKRYYSNRDLA